MNYSQQKATPHDHSGRLTANSGSDESLEFLRSLSPGLPHRRKCLANSASHPLPPPLQFLPKGIESAYLHAYRTDYQAFRSGGSTGSVGEVGELRSNFSGSSISLSVPNPGSSALRRTLDPPLDFLPKSIDPMELQGYRSDYQQFRAGRSAGAFGEISALCRMEGAQHRPYKTACYRKRVSWLGELHQDRLMDRMQRSICFCSSTTIDDSACSNRVDPCYPEPNARSLVGHSHFAATALAAAAAASTGAIMTTVAFYPVELVKNRLQSAIHGGCGGGFQYSGLLDGLQTILRDEGVTGLFTGLRAVVVRAFASDFATVYFGEALISCCGGGRGPLELPLRVAGGWISVALTLPLELISTRVTCTSPPISALVATKQLWREGGFGAFWRGLRVMLVLCLNPALTFTAFGWLRCLLLAFRSTIRPQTLGVAQPAPVLQWWEAFLVGVSAKMATLVAVYPLIRAKFVLQSSGAMQEESLFGVLRRLAVHDGLAALYRGLSAQLSKSLLSSALMLAIKEQTEEGWRSLLFARSHESSQMSAHA